MPTRTVRTILSERAISRVLGRVCRSGCSDRGCGVCRDRKALAALEVALVGGCVDLPEKGENAGCKDRLALPGSQDLQAKKANLEPWGPLDPRVIRVRGVQRVKRARLDQAGLVANQLLAHEVLMDHRAYLVPRARLGYLARRPIPEPEALPVKMASKAFLERLVHLGNLGLLGRVVHVASWDKRAIRENAGWRAGVDFKAAQESQVRPVQLVHVVIRERGVKWALRAQLVHAVLKALQETTTARRDRKLTNRKCVPDLDHPRSVQSLRFR